MPPAIPTESCSFDCSDWRLGDVFGPGPPASFHQADALLEAGNPAYFFSSKPLRYWSTGIITEKKKNARVFKTVGKIKAVSWNFFS
jgi:hypothetical protein